MTHRRTGPARVLILILTLAMAAAAATLLPQEGAEAHPCTFEEDTHGDDRMPTGYPCNQTDHDSRHGKIIFVHGGRDHDMVLEVQPPLPPEGQGVNDYLQAGDEIRITLAGYDLSNPVALENGGLITIGDSSAGANPPAPPRSITAHAPSQTLTLTLGAFQERRVLDADTHLVITIKSGTNILAPEEPSGFDEKDEPYPVAVTFVDNHEDGLPDAAARQHHFVAVRNPVSSTIPGEGVRVDLHTHAYSPVHGNEEVVVDFSGPTEDTSFTVPESIDPNHVTIAWKGQSPTQAAGVVVQGRKVIVTVPVIDDEPTEIAGDYSITFKERAKIENPRAAGNRIIAVYPLARPGDVDEIIAVIRRTTTADPPRGPRGSAFTLEGKGYADGTVTVFDGENEIIDAGEMLGFANTEKGAFTLELTARGDPGTSHYAIRTLDGNGVYHSVDFPIESAMSFDPERVRSGQELGITVRDWEREHPALAAITIGGIIAYEATAVEYEDCFELAEEGLHTRDQTGTISLRLRVPARLPPGRQNVAAFGPDHVSILEDGSPPAKPHCSHLDEGDDDETRGSPIGGGNGVLTVTVSHDPVASKPVEVVGRALRVLPRTAARGQKVTIIGSGIDRMEEDGRDIGQISIGGTVVAEDPSDFEVPANGEYALDVTIPDDALDGTNEVRVVGKDLSIAHGTIVVESPELKVTPGGGRHGASFTVDGRGFVAQGLISVYYGDGGDLASGEELLKVLIADRKGAFTTDATVPLDAELGARYIVTAVAKTGGDRSGGPVRASDNHTVSAGRVGADAETACPGDTLTVTGQNLPPFATVTWITLGGVQLSPGSRVHTDKAGAFTADARVPHLEAGNQTLQVLVAETVFVDVVEIVGPPLTGPPARVFKELIRAGVLERVWHFENSTQTWSFFDPDPMFAGFNDLPEVRTDDILFIRLTDPRRFRGESLAAGWNAIRLQ